MARKAIAAALLLALAAGTAAQTFSFITNPIQGNPATSNNTSTNTDDSSCEWPAWAGGRGTRALNCSAHGRAAPAIAAAILRPLTDS
jgi:hypothetical protein